LLLNSELLELNKINLPLIAIKRLLMPRRTDGSMMKSPHTPPRLSIRKETKVKFSSTRMMESENKLLLRVYPSLRLLSRREVPPLLETHLK
jgi:hypothetical protein